MNNSFFKDLMNYYESLYSLDDIKKHERELIILAQNNDQDAIQKLVYSVLKYIYKLSLKYSKNYDSCYTSIEDIFGVGIVGCMKAIKYFSLDKNIRFLSFASIVIENEIKYYIRTQKINKIQTISINTLLINDSDGSNVELEDLIVDYKSDKEFNISEIKIDLAESFKYLTPKERFAVVNKYELNGKNYKRAKDLTVSGTTYYRWRLSALKKLRKFFMK